MGKYFLAIARHAKAQEFLELKPGATTMMEYVARFIELACYLTYRQECYLTLVHRIHSLLHQL